MTTRQINVARMRADLQDKRLAQYEYVDQRGDGRVCRCAIGELGHCAGMTDAELLRLDALAGEAGLRGVERVNQMTVGMRRLDELLAQRYAIDPYDRNAIEGASDGASDDTTRWYAAVACADARNELLRAGRDPDPPPRSLHDDDKDIPY